MIADFEDVFMARQEVACSAAAAEGNKRGVRSTDALAIVAAYLLQFNFEQLSTEKPNPVASMKGL
jgi:hypothetical protein